MLKDMIEARDTHVRFNPEITLLEAYDRYQTFNRSEGKSPRTIDWYEHRLGKLAASFGWDGPMGEFEEHALREHIVAYKTNAQTGTPLKASTVNNHVRALRAFFRWAYLQGFTETHLLARYRPPKIPQELIEPLSEDEIERLLQAAKRRGRDLAIVMLLLDTGLRAAELCGLSVRDVDLARSTAKVMGKGGKERIVPFGRKTRKALVEYALDERPDAGADEAVFLRRDAGRLRPDTLRLLMQRLRGRARLPRLHPHLLRHTFATRFLLNGGNALMLKHILGHTTLAMTDRYVHFVALEGITAGRAFSPMDLLGRKNAKEAGSPASDGEPSNGWTGLRLLG